MNPDARLLAVCDVDSTKAKAKASEWGVAEDYIFTDYDKMLRNDDVEAIDILVPHHLHAEMTVKAAEAGKHVSVQKPMAMNLNECRSMIGATRKAGVKFRVLENFRFYPPYQKAKEILENGLLGRPSFIHIKLGTSLGGGWEVPADAWEWRLDANTCGGGPLVWDDGYHKFSIAEYFLGEVEKVKAWIDYTGVFEDDQDSPTVLDSPSVLIWKYKAPRTYGSMEVTYSRDGNFSSSYYTADERVEITGDKGYIWINQCTARTIRNEAPLITYISGELTEYNNLETNWISSFTAAIDHFIDAILNDSNAELNGEKAMEIQRFAQAAHDSSRTGAEVRLDTVE